MGRDHRGKRSSTTEKNKELSSSEEDGDVPLLDTVEQMFAPCVGILDLASLFFQQCKGHTNARTRGDEEAARSPVLKRSGYRKPRRRHGSTLEVPAHGGFEDDVSALSANTLEEMERLARYMARRAGNKSQVTTDPTSPSPGQILVPPPAHRNTVKDSWAYSVQRATSKTDQSIAVSTSGSASSQEDKAPHPQDIAENFTSSFRHFVAQVGK